MPHLRHTTLCLRSLFIGLLQARMTQLPLHLLIMQISARKTKLWKTKSRQVRSGHRQSYCTVLQEDKLDTMSLHMQTLHKWEKKKPSWRRRESAPSCPPNQPMTVGAFFSRSEETLWTLGRVSSLAVKADSQLWCVRHPETLLSSGLWVKSPRTPEM